MLGQFRSKLSGRDLRVIVSTRSEPVPQETVSPFWRQFREFSLPEFQESDLRNMLLWLAENRGIACERGDLDSMVADSDLSPAMMVNQVEIASNRGEPLTLELWRHLRSVDWSDLCRHKISPSISFSWESAGQGRWGAAPFLLPRMYGAASAVPAASAAE